MHLAMPGVVENLFHFQCDLAQVGWTGPGFLRPFTNKSHTSGPLRSTGHPVLLTWLRSYAANPPIWCSATLCALGLGQCYFILPSLASIWCGVTPSQRTSSPTWYRLPTLRDISPTPTLSLPPLLSTRLPCWWQSPKHTWVHHVPGCTTLPSYCGAHARPPGSTRWLCTFSASTRFTPHIFS